MVAVPLVTWQMLVVPNNDTDRRAGVGGEGSALATRHTASLQVSSHSRAIWPKPKVAPRGMLQPHCAPGGIVTRLARFGATRSVVQSLFSCGIDGSVPPMFWFSPGTTHT